MLGATVFFWTLLSEPNEQVPPLQRRLGSISWFTPSSVLFCPYFASPRLSTGAERPIIGCPKNRKISAFNQIAAAWSPKPALTSNHNPRNFYATPLGKVGDGAPHAQTEAAGSQKQRISVVLYFRSSNFQPTHLIFTSYFLPPKGLGR